MRRCSCFREFLSVVLEPQKLWVCPWALPAHFVTFLLENSRWSANKHPNGIWNKSRKILTSPKITKQFQYALTRGTCYSYSGGVWCNYCHPDPSACGRGVPCCSWWHWIRRIRRIRCRSQTIGFTRPNLYVSLKVDVFFQPMFSKRIAVSVQETMVFIEK